MVETAEKSTEAIAQQAVWERDGESVILDSRLALYSGKIQWLAVSDLHYGYEVRRRAGGGLFPLWGREAIEARMADLIEYYSPETLILNGDIIDGAASGTDQALDWLKDLEKQCSRLILIEGNHDRGRLLREMKTQRQFEVPGFLFHHGHLPRKKIGQDTIEVTGHIHPCFKFRDGAGLSMKFPSLVQEKNRWIMPAFSPWAGGVRYETEETDTVWACSPKRIFQIPPGFSEAVPSTV